MEIKEITNLDISIPKIEERANLNVFSVVSNYTGDEFEEFILEYLLFVVKEKNNYKNIYKVGASGDHGIDILCGKNNEYFYYQCKHYKSPLTKANVFRIINKIFYYVAINIIKLPTKIFIIGMNDFSPEIPLLTSDGKKFKAELIGSIESNLHYEKIKFNDEIVGKIKTLIENYDINDYVLSQIKNIIEDYYNSPIGKLRFDNNMDFVTQKIDRKELIDPKFQQQLLDLPGDNELKELVISDSLESYYSALCVKLTDYYYFNSNKEFDNFIDEIYEAEKYNLFKGCNNIEEVTEILEKSTHVICSKSYLDRRLNIIGAK